MTLVLVALGAFLAGQCSSVAIGRYWFLVGLQLGRDERALDPGETTGSLTAVGESSGRHALPDWPATEDTVVIEAVSNA